MSDRFTLLYFACVLAGFALANVPTSSLITEPVTNFFNIIGGIVVIVFSLALVHLGFRKLFTEHFR